MPAPEGALWIIDPCEGDRCEVAAPAYVRDVPCDGVEVGGGAGFLAREAGCAYNHPFRPPCDVGDEPDVRIDLRI